MRRWANRGPSWSSGMGGVGVLYEGVLWDWAIDVADYGWDNTTQP